MSQPTNTTAATLYLLSSCAAPHFGLPRTDIVAAAGRARFAVRCFNVDEDPEIAEALGVVALPALVATSGGEVIARTEGAISGFDVRAWLFDNVVATPIAA